MAAGFTVLVFVLLVIINMVAASLSARYNLSLDLTGDRIFTLSGETGDLLRALNKDVVIYILSSEDDFIAGGEYFVQANELIKRYSHNARITVRYVDMLREPTFPASYADLVLNAGDILIESGARKAVLTSLDLFNTVADNSSIVPRTLIVSSRVEQAVSSAILNVTVEKMIKIAVLTGHNEGSVDGFAELLQANNYEVVRQNLMTEEIDPEAAVAVLNAPARDITEDEARKLDVFLNNDGRFGKTFFYLASVTQPAELPVLDAFFEEWGFRVNPGAVFETNNARLFQTNIFMTIADYMENEYAASVIEKSLIPAIAFARPLETLFNSSGNTTTTGLLEFSDTAGVMPPDAGPDWAPGSQDASGPILALGMGQRMTFEGTTLLVSTVLISGSETLINPQLLSEANVANAEYILGLLDRLAGREDVVHIRSKTIGSDKLPVTFAQMIWISVALTIVVPLIVVTFGIVVWLRRRHR